MIILGLIVLCLVLLFGFVVFVGPPYLPTTRKQIEAALDLLALHEGDVLLELGSGDGRVMAAAARRGWRVVGIELNPLLVIFSWLTTRRYGRRVRVIWGSYWGAPWPRADAIFTFMLPKYMAKLDQRIIHWHNKPIKLASFAFTIPERKPVTSKDGVYLYEYK